MKIRMYAVTYNSPRIFNDWFLRSLKSSNYELGNVEVFVINNHSNFFIDNEYKDLVTVLNNDLRPDFSTGHLSRNWNQAIINGFENLSSPACDYVIGCQGDTILKKDWYSSVLSVMTNYKYVVVGTRDQFQIFTPESIKTIGLYDERFCGIGYQEADFFIRARIRFGEHSSINDYPHNRIWNPLTKNELIESTMSGSQRGDVHHSNSSKFHPISRNFYDKKWSMHGKSDRWNNEIDFVNISQHIPMYVLYPYFEKDINRSVYE